MSDFVYYRGTVPLCEKKIFTGNAIWDNNLFVADNIKSAQFYGDRIEKITISPHSKILKEGTREFKRVAGTPKKGGLYLEFLASVVKKAKSLRYDVIKFERQTDVGTVILNRNIIIKREFL